MTGTHPGYEEDYSAWLAERAALLRRGQWGESDVEQTAEELEGMGKGERRAIEGDLRIVIVHLLKWRHQPSLPSPSRLQPIDNARDEIERRLADCPSLRPRLDEMVRARYANARKNAMRETGLPMETSPQTCPFGADELLDERYLPE